MTNIKFRILQANDDEAFHVIAAWYLNEWKIPTDKTMQRLLSIANDSSQFQILLTINDNPVATAGLYHHVGLLDKEPRFNVYKNWLALVYTIPEQRGKGYGAMLCREIEKHSEKIGIKQMYLFTDTAEQLYKRLGWSELERIALNERNVVVMKKDLRIKNTISTDRLNLKILSLGDDDFIKALVNSKGWIEYIGDRSIHSMEDAKAYVHKILSTENLFYWVVRTKDTNTSIGIISFLKRNYLDNFDVGFAFLPEFNGKGYAYEATKGILKTLSEQAEFETIMATTIPTNKSSIKLLLKLGFSFEKETEVENETLHIYTNNRKQ